MTAGYSLTPDSTSWICPLRTALEYGPRTDQALALSPLIDGGMGCPDMSHGTCTKLQSSGHPQSVCRHSGSRLRPWGPPYALIVVQERRAVETLRHLHICRHRVGCIWWAIGRSHHGWARRRARHSRLAVAVHCRGSGRCRSESHLLCYWKTLTIS